MGPKKLDPSLIWEIPKRKHFCSGFQPLVSIVFLGGARCNNIHLYYPTLSTYIAVCSFFQRLHPSIYPISDPILSAKSLGRTFCPPIKDPSQEEGRKQLDRILEVVTERGYTFPPSLVRFPNPLYDCQGSWRIWLPTTRLQNHLHPCFTFF